MRILNVSILATSTAAALALTACGSSKPPYQDKLTRQSLATATVLLNVVGNPAKYGYGNYVPSPQTVSQLQGDCAAFRVNGNIWPAALTTTGSS